jgi:diaminohydroxyphosphoribosylaminopyrimidine deaminase / 5-amino-6-(5-phosphoribosylamino)uracil reductase
VSDDTRLDERDRAFMRRALSLAQRGWGRTAPNPMVGAVVVSDEEVVGEGWHAEYGGPHAEVAALADAGDRARGATLYVSLEPCSHHGRTPPCTSAIVAAGIRRVVWAEADPGVESGGGSAVLRAAGIEVAGGVESKESRELNAPFFRAAAGGEPWVILKLALSVDGGITDAARSSAWLTGDAARAEVHRMRAGVDAILVGVGTVLCDDPLLTVRYERQPRVAPLKVVLDRGFRTPAVSKLARMAREHPTLIVSTDPDRAAEAGERRRELESQGVETLATGSIGTAMRALSARGVRSILVEGGAGVAASLLAAGSVDRLVIFRAPILLGAGALNPFADLPPAPVDGAERMRVLSRDAFGDDVRTIYAIREP